MIMRGSGRHRWPGLYTYIHSYIYQILELLQCSCILPIYRPGRRGPGVGGGAGHIALHNCMSKVFPAWQCTDPDAETIEIKHKTRNLNVSIMHGNGRRERYMWYKYHWIEVTEVTYRDSIYMLGSNTSTFPSRRSGLFRTTLVSRNIGKLWALSSRHYNAKQDDGDTCKVLSDDEGAVNPGAITGGNSTWIARKQRPECAEYSIFINCRWYRNLRSLRTCNWLHESVLLSPTLLSSPLLFPPWLKGFSSPHHRTYVCNIKYETEKRRTIFSPIPIFLYSAQQIERCLNMNILPRGQRKGVVS